MGVGEYVKQCCLKGHRSTRDRLKHHRGLHGGMLGLCLLVVAILPLMTANAADDPSPVLVVLSDHTDTYQQVAAAISQRLLTRRPSQTLKIVSLDALSNIQASEPRLLVTVGLRATQKALESSRKTPILATLVPRLSYERLLQQLKVSAENRAISAVYLDQPLSRQVALIKYLLPQIRRAGTLLSPTAEHIGNEVRVIGRNQHLDFIVIQVKRPAELIDQLHNQLDGIEVLLTLFDPQIIDRKTAKQILYFSYQKRLPLIAYSKAMVTAGALAAVYSDNTQIGQQTADQIMTFLDHPDGDLPEPSYASYFSVACNMKMARYLNLAGVCRDDLSARIQD